jgi:23S rRNA (cytosine1962-C5)-methyltransferase
MFSIILKPGRDRPVRRKHPWIFSGAIGSTTGNPEVGDTVDILSADEEWLARGAYSPNSQIRVRIWTWDQEEINEAFFRERVSSALKKREAFREDQDIEAYREIHAESDLLPGLILDRYGSFRVVQFLSQGVERHRETILSVISHLDDFEGIYERSDTDARTLEGLRQEVGTAWGREPPDQLKIRENDLLFLVDLCEGHKTGFYLDQRQNRQFVRKWIAGDVLDAFCYSGAFSVAALRSGASSITSVDSSAQALNLTSQNLALNGFQDSNSEQVEADVFKYLRTCRDSRRQFDTIILHPPKFAASASHVDKAARGYKDINLLAFKLLRPGGTLITFSCSGGVSPELFEKIVADAALDAQVEAAIHAVLGQADDHPVRLNFPEGRYLKGLICRVHE